MEDIIKKIKDHPQFIFADSDDELISIIDEVNPGLTHGQKFDIIDELEKLERSGSRKGQDFTAQGIQTVANAFKDVTTKKIPDAIGKLKKERDGSRKGTGPLCDLGSVSGKGSRPENLGSIASKVALGRKRSVNMDGEYVEQESRKGNSSSDVEEKYGKVVADQLRLADKNYDLFLPDNSIMYKYDVTQEQLDFYRSVMGYQQSREGSRRGDALAQQIIGDNVEDSDGYNFYDAREALRLEGYSEDEIEDNIDTWMYQHMN